jgi:hypothetical protein
MEPKMAEAMKLAMNPLFNKEAFSRLDETDDKFFYSRDRWPWIRLKN